jgi:hypothetical protein
MVDQQSTNKKPDQQKARPEDRGGLARNEAARPDYFIST